MQCQRFLLTMALVNCDPLELMHCYLGFVYFCSILLFSCFAKVISVFDLEGVSGCFCGLGYAFLARHFGNFSFVAINGIEIKIFDFFCVHLPCKVEKYFTV